MKLIIGIFICASCAFAEQTKLIDAEITGLRFRTVDIRYRLMVQIKRCPGDVPLVEPRVNEVHCVSLLHGKNEVFVSAKLLRSGEDCSPNEMETTWVSSATLWNIGILRKLPQFITNNGPIVPSIDEPEPVD